MARFSLFILVLIFLFAAMSCRPAPGGDSDGNGVSSSQGNGQNGVENSVGKHYLLGLANPFDWTTVRYDQAVTVLHTFERPDDNVSSARVAALNATGSRIVYGDDSAEEGLFGVWLLEEPEGRKRELFSVKSPVEKLYLSDLGNAVFALSSDGGYLFSITEDKIWAQVDYDDCKEAVGISPIGTDMVCWGGGTRSVYHFSREYNSLNAIPFWEEPIPSDPSEVYDSVPVRFFPSPGKTGVFIQLGLLDDPAYTFLNIDTGRRAYTRYQLKTGAYLVGSIRSKDGNTVRALVAPRENYRGRNAKGEIPLMYKAAINLNDMTRLTEKISPLSRLPLALDRLADNALVRGGGGGLAVLSLMDGGLITVIPGKELGDFKLIGAASDLAGVLVIVDDELRWIDLNHFSK